MNDSSPNNSFTTYDFAKSFVPLWVSRKSILLFTTIMTFLAIVVSLILPENFRSSLVILPDSEKSKLAGLTGFSDLIESAGISWGGDKSPVKLYPTIVKSEAVLKNVIFSSYTVRALGEPVNLIKYWGITSSSSASDYEKALAMMRANLDVTLDAKTNVLTLSILTREPQLSADIVNNVANELDQFIRTKRRTSASEQRKWIDSRLIEVKKDLERAENKLKEFREANRRPSDSPQLYLEQERLIREVTINSTMYVELKKQYELVKIEEIKNIPIINIMDGARPAAKKETPKRLIIVSLTLLLAFFISCVYVVFVRRYGADIARINSRFSELIHAQQTTA